MIINYYYVIFDDIYLLFFFFQAEDGIRDKLVTGVQTCALPIFLGLAACGDEETTPAPDPAEPKEEMAPGPTVDTDHPPAPPADAQDEPVPAPPATTPANPNMPPQCGKHLTVISTVGVPGASKFVTNGCWSV